MSIIIFRALYLSLIIFEFLNLIEILNFSFDFNWFGLVIVASCVWLTIELLIYKLKKQQYLSTVLGLSFLVVFLGALGDICRFYFNFGVYDQFLHLLGGAVIAFLIFILIKDLIRSPGLHSVFIIGITNLFGVLYEIEEDLEDVFIHHRPVRLGTGPDTANDLADEFTRRHFYYFYHLFWEKFFGTWERN